MTLSMASRLGEILKDPRYIKILDKHIPGISKNPQISMGSGMSIKILVSLPPAKAVGFTKDKLEAVIAEINTLPGA